MIARKVYFGWIFVLTAAFVASATAHAQPHGLPDFTGIVTATSPAVVNISTSQNVKPQSHPMPHD